MKRREAASMDERLSRAAANNAQWCRTVTAAHGMTSTFSLDYWLLTTGSTLPLYPNLVTLREEGTAAQLECIERERRSGSTPWSVKDSFNRLDLRPMGFDVLVDAEWFFGQPDAHTQAAGPGARVGAEENGGGELATCQRVGSAAELRAWETAWAQRPGDWSFGDRVFPPALLHDERIAFLFANGDAGIRAGLVANCHAGVVGLSNAFAPSGQVSDLVGCLRQATALWPGLPMVGYGTGDELEGLERLGFERTGPCRIWHLVSET
jgi:hypothetical protein